MEEFVSMKALILGESIFTGKEIAIRLISRGYNVYVLNTGKHPGIEELSTLWRIETIRYRCVNN